jgi:hypothetical protein
MDVAPVIFKAGCMALSLVIFRRLAQHWLAADKLLPPGPRGYPIIGNIIEWPLKKPWKTMTEWAKLYGEYLNSAIAALCSSDMARQATSTMLISWVEKS